LVFSPRPFVAVYRVKDEAVEIVRVLHGAQRWP
jgi:plasmid stabilization system protein ParE